MRTTVRVALALTVAAVLAAAAGADVLKHKRTGETLRGTLTPQRINKMNVFRLEMGGTRLIDPAEWEIVERSASPAPATAQPGPAAHADTAASAPEGLAPARLFVIPITGPIMHQPLVAGVEKALDQAREWKADVVVFRMNTPGGRVDLGDTLIRLIQNVDWAKTAAWVEGEDKQALSCGAYLCLATHAIYMVPGSTLGAATPFSKTSSGSAAVDEKFRSAFRARFRSLAQERGHPSAIADAMVDHTASAVQVFIGDEQHIVSIEEADRLKKEHPKDFKMGKVISKPGKIVTLTSKEAVEFGVADAEVESLDAMAAAMGHPAHQARDAEWLPEWVDKEAKRIHDEFEKLRTSFNALIGQAQMTPDPRKRQVLLKGCAKTLLRIEKLAEDPTNDIRIPEEYLNNMKAQLQALYGASRR